jgi:hypothetical protein
MRFSLPILRLIRESGVLLVTRIAGLLLSAIAVQLVADAVRAFIAGEGSAYFRPMFWNRWSSGWGHPVAAVMTLY